MAYFCNNYVLAEVHRHTHKDHVSMRERERETETETETDRQTDTDKQTDGIRQFLPHDIPPLCSQSEVSK